MDRLERPIHEATWIKLLRRGHNVLREHVSFGMDHRPRICPCLSCTVHVDSNGSLLRRRVLQKSLALLSLYKGDSSSPLRLKFIPTHT